MAQRIKEYWGAFLRQIRGLDWNKDQQSIKEKTKAPIEHTFNNHEYCDISWCYQLQADKEGLVYTPPDSRPFYDKEEDNKMYCQLCNGLGRFQEPP